MAINKTAELVKQWAEFELTHPNADIEDFYRYQLISTREKQNLDGFLGGIVPPGRDQTLIKLMGRVVNMFVVFAEYGMKDIGIGQMEEFTFINAIHNMKMPKKTAVINENFIELSSGLLIIDRLKKKGWVIEHTDKKDKRNKLLELSPNGIETLFNCYMKLEKICTVFFKDMPAEDISLCVQLLKPVEINNARNWQKNKADRFTEWEREV